MSISTESLVVHSSASTERRGQEEGEVEKEGKGGRERGDTAAIYLMPHPDRGLTSVL